MKKLLITVPVYGDLYSDIFLNHQLKAFLDPTNIPSYMDRVDFAIYTDAKTRGKIEKHPNAAMLDDFCPSARFFEFTWPDNADRFHNRYQVLVSTFRMSVVEAMKTDSYLSAIVADLVPAQGYIGQLLNKLDAGYDSVFMLPLRSAYEAMKPYLDQISGAPTPVELCTLGYSNLHPLWVACHWDNAQFSQLPFSLLWNSGSGLLARSFSITPIAFQPTHEMISCGKLIDVEIPGMMKNPYWCHDWTDAPIIGVEPLKAYYPPFSNRPANTKWMHDWVLNSDMAKTQIPFLKEPLYYPCKAIANIPEEMKVKSDLVVEEILGNLQ